MGQPIKHPNGNDVQLSRPFDFQGVLCSYISRIYILDKEISDETA